MCKKRLVWLEESEQQGQRLSVKGQNQESLVSHLRGLAFIASEMGNSSEQGSDKI